MTSPILQLPSVQQIASLPKRSQLAYAIRCAKRAEPLYAEKYVDSLRARHVTECIDLATNYFFTQQLDDTATSIIYDYKASFKDHAVQAAEFAVMAAEALFNESNDPDYDHEEAEDDETTTAHRVESTAIFSLLSVYESHSPIEEARRLERLALTVTLADFGWLNQNQDFQDLTDVGPLWQQEVIETFANRLAMHQKLLKD